MTDNTVLLASLFATWPETLGTGHDQGRVSRLAICILNGGAPPLDGLLSVRRIPIVPTKLAPMSSGREHQNVG